MSQNRKMSALIMIQPLLRATKAAGSVKEITKKLCPVKGSRFSRFQGFIELLAPGG